MRLKTIQKHFKTIYDLLQSRCLSSCVFLSELGIWNLKNFKRWAYKNYIKNLKWNILKSVREIKCMQLIEKKPFLPFLLRKKSGGTCSHNLNHITAKCLKTFRLMSFDQSCTHVLLVNMLHWLSCHVPTPTRIGATLFEHACACNTR